MTARRRADVIRYRARKFTVGEKRRLKMKEKSTFSAAFKVVGIIVVIAAIAAAAIIIWKKMKKKKEECCECDCECDDLWECECDECDELSEEEAAALS